MWFVTDATLTRGAEPAMATMAQTKIRAYPLTPTERDMIADLFIVLEGLVARDELPAEARGLYDQAVMLLAQRYE